MRFLARLGPGANIATWFLTLGHGSGVSLQKVTRPAGLVIQGPQRGATCRSNAGDGGRKETKHIKKDRASLDHVKVSTLLSTILVI